MAAATSSGVPTPTEGGAAAVAQLALRMDNRVSRRGVGMGRFEQFEMDDDQVKTHIREALKDAAMDGNVSELMKLLQSHRYARELINSNDYGYTPLMWAAAGGHLAAVRLLVRAGSRVGLSNAFDDYNAVLLSVQSGVVEVTRFLLACGASVEESRVRDRRGRTPLVLAAQNGHVEMVRYLLDCGANVNGCVDGEDNEGWTPLLAAVEEGHTEVVKLLVERGADVNSKDAHGNCPIIVACHWPVQSKDSFGVLLAHPNLNIDARCNSGDTALLVACSQGHLYHAQMLCDNGADPTLRNNRGVTALMYACRNGDVELCKALVTRGADINVPDSVLVFRWMPIHYAAHSGQLEIVKLLLENGADATAQNANGQNALALAYHGSNEQVIDLLKRRLHNLKFKIFLRLSIPPPNPERIESCENVTKRRCTSHVIWYKLPQHLFQLIWEFYKM